MPKIRIRVGNTLISNNDEKIYPFLHSCAWRNAQFMQEPLGLFDSYSPYRNNPDIHLEHLDNSRSES